MEPLATNRRCLIWLCICPVDESISQWKKIAYTIFTAMVLSGLIGGSVACLVFSWKSASIDVGQSMYAFTFVAAQFTSVYFALVGVSLLRHKIGKIFKDLSAIYKNSEFAFLFSFGPSRRLSFCCNNNKFTQREIFSFSVAIRSPYSDEAEDSFEFLARVNDTSEWMWRIYLNYITGGAIFINLVISPIISVLFNCFIKANSNVENFYHPVPYAYENCIR